MATGLLITVTDTDALGIPSNITPNLPNDMLTQPGVAPTIYDPASDLVKSGGTVTKGVVNPQGRVVGAGYREPTFFDDYYNQIWMLPRSIDFGAVSGEATVNVKIWNAYWNTSVTLTSISSSNSEGLFLTGSAIPKVFKPLEQINYDIKATSDGPATIDASYAFNFSNGTSVNLPVSGNRARAWSNYHNWSDSFTTTYTFSTETLTSRSGKEQRIANRVAPRKTLSYYRTMSGDAFRDFNALMWSWQHRTFVMPELVRKVTLTSPVAGFTTTWVVPGTKPRWIVVGATLMFLYQDQQEVRTVAAVNGSTITFKATTPSQWPVGTQVYNAVSGYLDTQLSTTRKTNHTASANLAFNITPLSEPYLDPGAPTGPVLNGREIFDLRPNWAEDISVTMGHDVETVDYGWGPVSRFFPIAFGTYTRSQTYLGKTPEAAEKVIEFFHRRFGQQGEFYMPTWDADIVPKKDAPAGTSNLRVAGLDFFKAYGSSTVHKAVAVRLLDGTMVYRKVSSLIGVTDIEGSDSVITIEGSWPSVIGPETISFISWMPVWCFASDTLTVENLTDKVAQFKLAMRSLEDLTPETF